MSNRRKKTLIFVICFLILGWVGLYVVNTNRKDGIEHTSLYFKDGPSVLVEIADTPLKRAQGLSGRESLAEGEGLLFVFDRPDFYSFWMKDMLFPIDIIWLSYDAMSEDSSLLSIVSMHTEVAPDSFPKTFTPSVPALFVLEVPAGFAEEHDLKIGQRIFFESEIAPR